MLEKKFQKVLVCLENANKQKGLLRVLFYY
jgi:hypothetical protein